ncbi:hypothetical protein OBBRIDRAFT_886952 [Obba rivulosa]|uniref:Transmembrane protein n=1 Tax=Obba rivulosa TaxID=1052685 RepID=A0A8E2B0E0_9APHY|nr:hypothetical protein OBBRIDRAFT_886952 [Obba rivulosa]
MDSVYKFGLSPGILVGLILVLTVLLGMLVSTTVILLRSRAARRNKRTTPTKTVDVDVDLEGNEDSFAVDKEHDQSASPKQYATGAEDRRATDEPHTVSKLSVIVTPSPPHLFKVETDSGGVEVRVTPPTPIPATAKHANRHVQFVEPASKNPAPSPDDPVWYFL